MSGQYTTEFFQNRKMLTQRSAEVILALLFSTVKPKSVIDLGCGTGTWLAESKKQGVSKVLGLDGKWVETKLLEISEEEFKQHDLETSIYTAADKFDLAISIEVAEHLSPVSGKNLIRSLTEASDIVLFSAAVCGQGGTGHINEQPQHYWAEQFSAHDFVCLDLIRPEIWQNDKVNIIYKQNMCLFVRSSVCLELNLEANIITTKFDLDRIHPELLRLRADRRTPSALVRSARKLKRLLKI